MLLVNFDYPSDVLQPTAHWVQVTRSRIERDMKPVVDEARADRDALLASTADAETRATVEAECEALVGELRRLAQQEFQHQLLLEVERRLSTLEQAVGAPEMMPNVVVRQQQWILQQIRKQSSQAGYGVSGSAAARPRGTEGQYRAGTPQLAKGNEPQVRFTLPIQAPGSFDEHPQAGSSVEGFPVQIPKAEGGATPDTETSEEEQDAERDDASDEAVQTEVRVLPLTTRLTAPSCLHPKGKKREQHVHFRLSADVQDTVDAQGDARQSVEAPQVQSPVASGSGMQNLSTVPVSHGPSIVQLLTKGACTASASPATHEASAAESSSPPTQNPSFAPDQETVKSDRDNRGDGVIEVPNPTLRRELEGLEVETRRSLQASLLLEERAQRILAAAELRAANLDHREEELLAKETELVDREHQLAGKELELSQKEQSIVQREEIIQRKETAAQEGLDLGGKKEGDTRRQQEARRQHAELGQRETIQRRVPATAVQQETRAVHELRRQTAAAIAAERAGLQRRNAQEEKDRSIAARLQEIEGKRATRRGRAAQSPEERRLEEQREYSRLALQQLDDVRRASSALRVQPMRPMIRH